MTAEQLNEITKLRAYCTGEAITDVYRYVQPVGRATKDPIVTWAGNETERWAGGTQAVARHMRGLGLNVDLFTQHNPIVKTRYVEQPFGRKVFSVVEQTKLEGAIPEPYTVNGLADLVVVTDYGHGWFVTRPTIDRCMLVWSKAWGDPFIALNVQANSLNWGMSLITKWPRADYIVCNENELRLAMGEAFTKRGELAQKLRHQMQAKALVVTLGHEGAEIYYGNNLEWRCPAYTAPGDVVDRMGAGDAFLAASAPLMACGGDPVAVLEIGSAAAALAVRSPGNSLVLTAELLTNEMERIK